MQANTTPLVMLVAACLAVMVGMGCATYSDVAAPSVARSETASIAAPLRSAAIDAALAAVQQRAQAFVVELQQREVAQKKREMAWEAERKSRIQRERAAARVTSAALSEAQRAEAQLLFSNALELFQAGEFEAAKLGLEEGLTIDPANGMAHYHLAETLMRLDATPQAQQHYALVPIYASRSKEALKARTALQKLLALSPPTSTAEMPRILPSDIMDMPGERLIFRDCAVCPEMVVVPPGAFTMGDLTGRGQADETPMHRVTLPRAFAVGRYEVTFAEWAACVRDGGCLHRPDDKGWGRGQRPVINVSWNDVQEYVTWLRRATGKHYRLPTEAEWEYVARVGTTTAYSFGNDVGRLGEYGWFENNSEGRTQPVGKKRPNAWGVSDVHGNVWEWVQDWDGAYSAWAVTDPAGAAGGSYRVVRGGSWNDPAEDCRSANRTRWRPDSRVFPIGLRLVRVVP